MRRALVLGGGGARGAFQAGMLDVLVRENGLDFEVLRGVSVGALNASFLAQAPVAGDSIGHLKTAVADLVRIWTQEIRGNRSVYTKRFGSLVGLGAGADSLFDNAPLAKLLRKHVDVERLRTSGRDFAVGVASLLTGEYTERRPRAEEFLELVLASTAIPVVFPPVRRKSPPDVLVDGGVREITPLSPVFKTRPDEIYVLMTSEARKRPDGTLPSNTVREQQPKDWEDNFLGTRVSGFTVLTRTVEILTDEIYLDDIRGALEWNRVIGEAEKLLAAASAPGGPPSVAAAAAEFRRVIDATKKRPVPIHVLAPRELFGEDNSATEFDPKRIARAIEHGREVARDPSKWLWP